VAKTTETEGAVLPSRASGVISNIPLTTRLAIEIPKPKDWQAFQRNCVHLFRAELNDPNASEYGRGGQKQRGIDVLGRRGGQGEHFVGVQCRLIAKPLKEEKILSDARDALTVKAGLKELIFATTAPDDTGATDAAIAVERALGAEGHELTITVYGWGQLQTLIAVHDVAYNAFHPSAVETTTPQAVGEPTVNPEMATLIATKVAEQLRASGVIAGPRESVTDKNEDPALHARIDIYRDLTKSDGQLVVAEKGLLSILEKEDLSAKPWARYRLETNLGSIALDLGREDDAAARFDAAYAIRPEDPNAIANLALARTIQGRFVEAIDAAQKALAGSPRADHAVAYLLQAAARSDWQGEPETLIPPDLVGSSHADIGLVEFLRRREGHNWAARTLEIARRHPDVPDFNRVRALAILALSIEGDTVIPEGQSPFSLDELNAAADDIKALAEKCLDVGFADLHDLTAHVSNAALLLRLCERHAESEKLLERGIPVVGKEPQLVRLLALARWVQDRVPEAIAALEGEADPENQLLRLQLQAVAGDPERALNGALAMAADRIPEKLLLMRWRLIGELAVQLNNGEQLKAAAAALRSLAPDDVVADLLEIRAQRKSAANEGKAQDSLRVLAQRVPADLNMGSRYFLALELKEHELAEEASQLLEGHIDLTRPSPATTLYLQCLAEARRDVAFQSALASTPPQVRNDPTILWLVAAHAWNQGDLPASLKVIQTLVQAKPDDPRARLLLLEILIRLDRSTELFEELQKPLERLAWKQPKDQFRLAALLGHFGFTERAASLAYQLFLQHRDLPRAWMTLTGLVLEEGRGEEDTPRLWNAETIAANAAVDIHYDDGTDAFFVVEPDASIRKLDQESWEPGHALVRAVMGLKTGDRFKGPDDRDGTIRQIRHKYVARLHFVLEHYESRFPEIFGLRRVAINVGEPGGLDSFVAQLKERRDWLVEEESQYSKGRTPLSVLAHRVGMDTIEVGAGLSGHGVPLNVAAGNLEERETSARNIRANQGRGCALDLLAFWTAWRLGALDIVSQTCGSVHLPQSVLDRLRARREKLQFHSHDGLKTAGYEQGRMFLHEVSAQQVIDLRDDTDRAIAWADQNAAVSPVVAGDDLPGALRELLQLGRSDVVDALVLARQAAVLLVTDDRPTRELDLAAGGKGGAWLHSVFGIALERGTMDFDAYVRTSANLIDAGHNYLGVSGAALLRAARLDAANQQYPGDLFKSLSRVIGGTHAEPVSHVAATVDCLSGLWLDPDTIGYRQPVTAHLLRRLIDDRPADYPVILRTVLARTRDNFALNDYIYQWLRGHFLVESVLERSKG
jgi:tetratricopeptide (TPR) repeat protein